MLYLMFLTSSETIAHVTHSDCILKNEQFHTENWSIMYCMNVSCRQLPFCIKLYNQYGIHTKDDVFNDDIMSLTCKRNVEILNIQLTI